MVIKTKTQAEQAAFEVLEREKEIEELKEKNTPLTDALKEFMGEHEFMQVGIFNLLFRNVKGSKLIDKKKLKSEFPDVDAAVEKTGAPSRKFSIEERLVNENKAN